MTIEAKFRLSQGDFELDVALNLPDRGVSALFGPTGCGKTTLLRLLAGLEYDPQGLLSVSGEFWQKGADFVPTYRRPLGYVFQEASLFSHLRVRENLEYGFKRARSGQDSFSFDEVVELLGLQLFLKRRVDELSGGERQRVAIAQALLTNPRLLLMDEPLSALDAASKSEVMLFLERLHSKLSIPIVYVSHIFNELMQLADHLVLMREGRVLTSGSFVEMVNDVKGPLAKLVPLGSVIEVEVGAHDREHQLTFLDFKAGRFTVAHKNLSVGRKLRLHVLASDVSLTLERQVQTSILNIFSAKIVEVHNSHQGRRLIRLDLGQGITLLSEVTHKSALLLDLKPGQSVFAQVKSVALSKS